MPKIQASIQSVKGFRAVGVHAGLKKEGKLDMALIVSDRNCVSAGVFTRNLVKAAPVLVNMEHLQANSNRMRAVAVNTISANAATGSVGLENSRTMAQFVAEQIEIEPEQVFVMSTGVIGTHLPMEKIKTGIESAAGSLGNNWHSAAEAIMTTDTRPKIASMTVLSVDGEYQIAGITKGSGMIAPNMATMLGVLVTDIVLTPEQAHYALTEAANRSYNRIVVDGDTSTNDMVLLLANGASGIKIASETDMLLFIDSLTQLGAYLAQEVVRDGEGATKFITIDLLGASSDEAASQIAHTIAASALVKTAFYGNDANWGRIIAAAGRSGVDFNPDTSSLWMTKGTSLIEEDRGLLLFDKGMKARYSEADATAIISEKEVYITLDLGGGSGHATVWTCDLSHEYVDINADYRS
jgi:glutamate N-acetyltransferase / amino-acid N-acetyltransferase